MRSRFIVLVGLVLALALVAAACSSDDTGDEGTTTTEATTTTTEAAATTTTAAPATTTTVPAEDLAPLVVWADDKRAPVIEAIAPAFTEATGVEIQVTLVDNDSMKDEVTTKAPAGEGPDIFIGAHDWVGELASSGVVAPIDLGGRDSEFTATGLNALKWDGAQYGLPYVTEAVGLYYNTDLVPEAPTTLVELTDACDAAGDAVENCLGVPGGNDGGDAYHHHPFLAALGCYIFGYDPASGFLTGVEAFWLTGPWEVGALQDQSDVNWSVTTLPTIDGSPMRPLVGVQGFYLSAFSENAAVAEEFLLNYIATDETMLALFEADPRGSAYVTTIEAVSGDPVNATFALSATTGQFMPNVPEMGAVWAPVGDNYLALRNGDIGAEEAAANMAEQVATVIAEG